jgi:hypothetical protein
VTQYEVAPVGEAEVEVVAASIGDVSWKVSDDNPSGACLRLRLSAGRDYSFIWSDTPCDWGRQLNAVRAAVGVSSEQLRPEQFIGLRARVSLKHYQAKDGTTRAAVARWLPLAKGEPKPGTKQATASGVKSGTPKVSRNAPPSYGDADDIAF